MLLDSNENKLAAGGRTLAENQHEVCHREVIHPVQLVQIIDEEVQQCAIGCHWAVHLSRRADLHLSLLGGLDLRCDVQGCALGLLQILNQSNVLQDITLSHK